MLKHRDCTEQQRINCVYALVSLYYVLCFANEHMIDHIFELRRKIWRHQWFAGFNFAAAQAVFISAMITDVFVLCFVRKPCATSLAKIQSNTIDLRTRLLGINPTNSVVILDYSQEPRTEVYYVRLNFSISKLVYYICSQKIDFESSTLIWLPLLILPNFVF